MTDTEEEVPQQFWQEADMDDSIAGKEDIKFSSTPFFRPVPGSKVGTWRKNRVRILPPRADHVDLNGNPKQRFYLWAATHYIAIANRFVLCPDRNFDVQGRCPICAEAQRLFSAGLKEDARDLWPNWRGLVNVIALNADGSFKMEEDETKPKVMVWAMPQTLLNGLLDRIAAELPKEKRSITSPVTGRDLIVKAKPKTEGKSPIIEFDWADDFCDPSPLAPEGIAVLGDMHLLSEVYSLLEPSKISALLAGPAPEADPFALPEGSAEEEEAAAPPPPKTPPPPEPEVAEGAYRELPPEETKATPAPASEEEEEAAAPAAPPKQSNRRSAPTESPEVIEARQRLQAALESEEEEDEEEE